MRFRRWKVEREVRIIRGMWLPAKDDFFWTRRGAQKMIDFSSRHSVFGERWIGIPVKVKQ